MSQGLNTVPLPDDVLLIVFSHVETTRDLCSLALSCRGFHRLISEHGWRIFVRSRFPSLSVSSAATPNQPGCGWQELARSLTWQSRQWDRRSLAFTLLRTGPRAVTGQPRPRGVPYQAVVDAYLDPQSRAELAVFGLGENFAARFRTRRGGTTQTEWRRLDCAPFGFIPGQDDIKAVIITKQTGDDCGLAFLAGRDSGGLILHSANPNRFGEIISFFSPGIATEPIAGAAAGEKPGQPTINSLDITTRGNLNLVAATTNNGVLLYPLPEEHRQRIGPLAYYDLKRHAFENDQIQLRCAKWMGSGDLLAIALRGTNKQPLRYLSLSETGWTDVAAAKTANFELFKCPNLGSVCPNSLQPVRFSGNDWGPTHLLLSSWRDGTCRLQDIRTRSPFDQVYADYVDPWAEMEALMTYGSERFVAGGLQGAALRVFDFRWTKTYYHTATLPCSAHRPFPAPHQPFQPQPEETSPPRDLCDHVSGRRCRWHELSRHNYYRPNATFYLKRVLPPHVRDAGVWSLAKAADFAPNFYTSMKGAVVEASLRADGIVADPIFSMDDPVSLLAQSVPVDTALEPSLMETGDGAAYEIDERDGARLGERNVVLPHMLGGVFGRSLSATRRLDMVPAELRACHRLDRRFQVVEEFAEVYGVVE